MRDAASHHWTNLDPKDVSKEGLLEFCADEDLIDHETLVSAILSKFPCKQKERKLSALEIREQKELEDFDDHGFAGVYGA